MDALKSTVDVVRSNLQPITANLPAPVKDAAVSLVGTRCYKSLIVDLDIEDAECVKLAVSKGLGVGIIGASSIVKIPQLLKLVRSRSSAGVSFLSYLLETTAYLITLAYNVRQGFPFSTYGESALIAAQNVVIAALVLQFAGRGAAAAVFVAGLAAAGYAIFNADLVNLQQLGYLQAGAGVLGVASKLPQIWTVWKQGGTGQLSAFAVRSASRIYTTLQEVDDKLILYGFIAGFALNAVLASQMIYYWNSSTTPAKSGKLSKAQREKITAGSTTGTASTRPSTRRRG
ncbi:MAG: hypothetical protein M1825_005228 [Sarcosagium campestre]|nr:MAG: hypothetical protein M1825_005228 [Sarcosagium campestre]